MSVDVTLNREINMFVGQRYDTSLRNFLGGGIDTKDGKKAGFDDFLKVVSTYSEDLKSYVYRNTWEEKINKKVEADDGYGGLLMIMDKMWMMEGEVEERGNKGKYSILV